MFQLTEMFQVRSGELAGWAAWSAVPLHCPDRGSPTLWVLRPGCWAHRTAETQGVCRAA